MQGKQQMQRVIATKKIGNYIIEKTLGKGTFGKVKLAIHQPTGEKVAIKILQKDKIIDVADVERVTRQIHILKLIRHPNIIQLYEIIESPKHLFLVMQYMQKGQLFDHIARKKYMNQDQACRVFEQIISGIQYIHRLKIVHRDLKLQNILIDYDETIRIVDFGLSNTYKIDQRLKTACGSPCYAAPEMIEAKQPYEPLMVDIWSAGVILYTMVCGCLPFEDSDTPTLYKKILSGQYNIKKNLSDDLKDFMKRVLTVNPHERIRISDMKMHRWWRKYSDNYYPQGLIVGYHKIPVDDNILQKLSGLGLDIDSTSKCLQANRHNNLTTTYYLLMKKFVKMGGISKADYNCKQFDKMAIQPNQRRKKNNQIKASDLVRIASPNNQKKNKSYYLGYSNQQKQNYKSNHINQSLKVQKKKKSKSKSKNKIKNNKSFSKDNTMIRIGNHQPTNKVISRSFSKRKKSPLKDISLIQEQYKSRSRAVSQLNKLVGKKSHQGSYMIGADSGVDWPLEPKFTIENTNKIKSSLRRK